MESKIIAFWKINVNPVTLLKDETKYAQNAKNKQKDKLKFKMNR